MLPRETDADMRRDDARTALSVETQPSMSAEECTAHQDATRGADLSGMIPPLQSKRPRFADVNNQNTVSIRRTT
jgi:hypothetical protein